MLVTKLITTFKALCDKCKRTNLKRIYFEPFYVLIHVSNNQKELGKVYAALYQFRIL